MLNNKRLISLEVIRGMAFLGVFFSHTGVLNNFFGCLGQWGVSIFLILSGFVMTYSYFEKDRIKKVSIKDNFSFACSKLKKIYILHIICTIAFFPFIIFGSGGGDRNVYNYIFMYIINMLLVQTWIPMDGTSINGVSWYLCTTIFFYFLFPYINSYIEKNYSIKKAIKIIVLCVIAIVSIGMIGFGIDVMGYSEPIFGLKDLSGYWHCFPPFRLLDTIIGCNLGYIFIKRKDIEVKSKGYWTALEICGVLLAIVANVFMDKYFTHPSFNAANGSVLNPEYWFKYAYVLCYCIAAMILIYIFAYGKGRISDILVKSKVILYFAKISPYGYLIHYVVFRYIVFVLYHIPIGLIVSSNLAFSEYEGWMKSTIGLVITIILSELWIHIIQKSYKYKNMIKNPHFE